MEDYRADSPLAEIYGDFVGAFLIGIPAALKVATRSTEPIYGLPSLRDLNLHSSVLAANSVHSGVSFFMDAANAWFYGCKNGQLYVFDAEDQTLELLGHIEPALDELLDEWTSALGCGDTKSDR